MKKFFSLVLALVMALSLTTVAWGATTVTTKQDLKDALAAGGEVVLDADIVFDDQDPKVPHGVEAVLDLNGHEISFTNGWRLIVAGTLTVKDTSADGDGTITANAGPTIQLGFTSDGKQPGATLNLLSGSIVNTNPNKVAIQGAGTAGTNSNQNTTVVISGGKVTAVGVAIYHPQAGTLSISGGEITGDSAIGMKSGTLNITGGTLKATGTYASAPATNSNGINTDGSVICIDSNSGYAGNMVVNISNATLTSTYGHIIREIGDGVTNDITSISVTSGTFTAAADKEAINLQDTTPSATASVSGGTFNTDVSEYVADGYSLDTATGAVALKAAGGAADSTLYFWDNATAKWLVDFVATGDDLDDLKRDASDDCLPCYLIDGEYFVETTNAAASFKLVYGTKTVYLAPVPEKAVKYADTASVLTVVEETDAECGDFYVADANYDDDDVYYISYNKKGEVDGIWVKEKNGPVQLLVGSKIVDAKVATVVDFMDHDWEGYEVVNKAYVSVKCSECGKVAKLYMNAAAAGKKAVNVGPGWITYADATDFGAVVPSAPSTDKVVQSAQTFDAGIAMYVGMSVMAAAGSVVVFKKRED